MTSKEAKSCIGTIEMLQRLAYNIHGVMDVIDADNCKKIIKVLEQEPKTGRWKPNFRYGMYPNEEHFICSECNGQSMRCSKYCPECGARMEKE